MSRGKFQVLKYIHSERIHQVPNNMIIGTTRETNFTEKDYEGIDQERVTVRSRKANSVRYS